VLGVREVGHARRTCCDEVAWANPRKALKETRISQHRRLFWRVNSLGEEEEDWDEDEDEDWEEDEWSEEESSEQASF
jgi:hypothetical protein